MAGSATAAPAAPARRRLRRLVIGALVAIALAGIALVAQGPLEEALGARAPLEPPPVASGPPESGAVSALGRLAPKDGVTRIAGPSLPAVVVQRLLVDKGDRVRHGQVIALLDDADVRDAAVTRARARVHNAEAEVKRHAELHETKVISDSLRDEFQLRLDVNRAELRQAEAQLERSRVRAPVDGQVIEVHARDGERVGPEGVIELARTHEMYAIAEVYETDIGRVRLGQRARVRSPALPHPLEGTVDRIGLKIGKMDALGTDPAARTDARVVEVEVRLDGDDVSLAAPLTHLQVEVEIAP